MEGILDQIAFFGHFYVLLHVRNIINSSNFYKVCVKQKCRNEKCVRQSRLFSENFKRAVNMKMITKEIYFSRLFRPKSFISQEKLQIHRHSKESPSNSQKEKESFLAKSQTTGFALVYIDFTEYQELHISSCSRLLKSKHPVAHTFFQSLCQRELF